MSEDKKNKKNNSTTNKDNEIFVDKKEEYIYELKSLNREWIKNPWLFWGGLILSPISFITALFIPIENHLLVLLQSLLFFISIGFVSLPLSYLFNLLWITTLKNAQKKDQKKTKEGKEGRTTT